MLSFGHWPKSFKTSVKDPLSSSNTLGKISESVNGGAISEAYKKAIMMAQGIME